MRYNSRRLKHVWLASYLVLSVLLLVQIQVTLAVTFEDKAPEVQAPRNAMVYSSAPRLGDAVPDTTRCPLDRTSAVETSREVTSTGDWRGNTAPMPVPLAAPLEPDLDSYTPHAPIVIEQNTDFESWPGEGTSDNPYVISALEIHVTGAGTCISISNTDVFFEIRDCYLHSDSTSALGINLTSVSNGLLYNNTCADGGTGLLVVQSDDIVVHGNTITNQSTYGINLERSRRVLVEENYGRGSETILRVGNCEDASVSDNWFEWYLGGIYIYNSSSTMITNNLCETGHAGITVMKSDGSVIDNNTCYDHASYYGIGIFESANCVVTRNNSTTGLVGIDVSASEGTWIEENLCYDYNIGIQLQHSNHSSAIGNTIRNGTTGVYVGASFNVDIIENDVFDHISGHGVHVFQSGHCLVSENNLSRTGEGSLFVFFSHQCTVTKNFINDTIDGVVAVESNFTSVTENMITFGLGYGIALFESSFSTVSENHVDGISGWEGYAFVSSGSENEFKNNLAFNSTYGFYLYGGTIEDHLSHNTVRGNDYAFHLLDSAVNITLTWNIFEDNVQNGLDDSVSAHIDYNYWSNYTGVDLDADGIGDTWHPIAGTAANNDTHPLVYYPTLPIWETEPTDQEAEYGFDFEYTLSLVTTTMIAPITEWSVNDTDFVIDNGVITNAVNLSLGKYPLEVRAYNLYGFYLSGIFAVTVDDTIAPTIAGPGDYSYVAGTTGHELEWFLNDESTLSYVLTINGAPVMSEDSFTPPGYLPFLVDGLSVGEYTLILTVTDLGGNTAMDTIIVTVVPGDVMPILLIVGGVAVAAVVIVVFYMLRKRGVIF